MILATDALWSDRCFLKCFAEAAPGL